MPPGCVRRGARHRHRRGRPQGLRRARGLRRRAGRSRSTRFAPDLVVLAGFMRILGAGFVRRYEGRMLNIHPSLLPAFPGLHTHRRAIEAGCKAGGRHGALRDRRTRPRADRAAGGGAGAAPATMPTRWPRACWPPSTRIYPRAVRWFVEGQLRVERGVVRHAGGEPQLLACLHADGATDNRPMHPDLAARTAAPSCSASPEARAPADGVVSGFFRAAPRPGPARAPHAGRDHLHGAAPAAAVPAPGAVAAAARWSAAWPSWAGRATTASCAAR